MHSKLVLDLCTKKDVSFVWVYDGTLHISRRHVLEKVVSKVLTIVKQQAVALWDFTASKADDVVDRELLLKKYIGGVDVFNLLFVVTKYDAAVHVF